MGTDKTMISQYEHGTRRPRQDRLLQIADYFGVSVDFLLTGGGKEATANCEVTGADGEYITLMIVGPAKIPELLPGDVLIVRRQDVEIRRRLG